MISLYNLKMYIKRFPVIEGYLRNKGRRNRKIKNNSLKDEGTDVLRKVETALRGKNVIHFLDFGSLLGAIRDGDFIDGDLDIDYGICINEIFSWKELETALARQGLKKIRQFSLNGLITEQTYINKNLTVDFFDHINVDDEYALVYEYYRKERYIYNSQREFHVRELKECRIDKIKNIDFKGIIVPIPVNPEEYLEINYTSSWKERNPYWESTMNDICKDLEREIGIVELF